MQIIRSLKTFEKTTRPIVVTIGNFDGVHPGHVHVIEEAIKTGKRCVVVTFENHPSEVITHRPSVNYICTLQHKIKLIKELNIDTLALLTFTKEFSLQSARVFLETLREHIPFEALVLGHDSRFGKNREGDPKYIGSLSQEWGFDLKYVDQLKIDDLNVSSSVIRSAIITGDLQSIEKFLGRPYSIYDTVVSGKGIGASQGFPTANLDVEKLCLPPFGVYAIKAKYDGELHYGVANLGIAPTIRDEKGPVLEAHLFDLFENLQGKMLEVIPVAFLRPEKKFDNREELKKQIALDVNAAKKILNIEK